MSTKKKLALAMASLATFIASSAYAQEPPAGSAANSFDMCCMPRRARSRCCSGVKRSTSPTRPKGARASSPLELGQTAPR